MGLQARIEMTVARIGEELIRLHTAILAGTLSEHGFIDQEVTDLADMNQPQVHRARPPICRCVRLKAASPARMPL